MATRKSTRKPHTVLIDGTPLTVQLSARERLKFATTADLYRGPSYSTSHNPATQFNEFMNWAAELFRRTPGMNSGRVL
jgi:hypothetical protein